MFVCAKNTVRLQNKMADQSFDLTKLRKDAVSQDCELNKLSITNDPETALGSAPASGANLAGNSLSSAGVERKDPPLPDQQTIRERKQNSVLRDEVTSAKHPIKSRQRGVNRPDSGKTTVPAPLYSGTVIDRLVTFIAHLLKKLEVALLNLLGSKTGRKEKSNTQLSEPKETVSLSSKPKKDRLLEAAKIIKRE